MTVRKAISSDSRPARNPDVVLKPVGSGAILHHPARRSVHDLNRVARAVWELCDGRHTSVEMEAAIRARFRVPKDRDLQADLSGILLKLLDLDLVRVESAR